MSWTDVSKMLGQELDLPIVKSDQPLRIWCLAAKGYTDQAMQHASEARW
jgi:hypothetical protein